VTQSRVELLWSKRELTTKVGNNLGLSLCAVPRSAVVCVVTYFRRTELLPGVQGRSGILIRVSVRATGHKTPEEFSVNITISSYDTTYL